MRYADAPVFLDVSPVINAYTLETGAYLKCTASKRASTLPAASSSVSC